MARESELKASTMDKKRLDYYKKKLQTRRDELMRAIARTQQEGREADEDPTVDLADKAANSYTKEFLFGQTHNDRAILQLVEDALGRIKDGSFGDVTKMTVYFKIWPSTVTQTPWRLIGPIQVLPTDTAGVGVATATTPMSGVAEGAYTMIAEVSGGNYYSSVKSQAVSVTVCSPTGSYAVGAGIVNDHGYPGVFGFVVRYDKMNKPTGDFLYIYFDGKWDIIVTGTAVTGIAISGNHVYFEGWCSVQQFNPTTGQIINDVGTFKYRVDAWDNSGLDSFQVHIYDEYGIDYHLAGGQGSQGQVIGVVQIFNKK